MALSPVDATTSSVDVTTADTSERSSRRGLLLGAAGALGVAAANSLAGTSPVGAATGDPVLLGSSNSAGAPTVITSNPGDVLVTQAGSTGRGIVGAAVGSDGVHGESSTASGVSGSSDHAAGVVGTGGDGGGALDAAAGIVGNGGGRSGGNSGPGVLGTGGTGSESTDGIGVVGIGGGSTDGVGVQAAGSGTAPGLAAYGGPSGGIGIVANGVGSAAGVSASTNSGDGVYGSSGTGSGVHGVSGGAAAAVLGVNDSTGSNSVGVQGNGQGKGVLGYGGQGVYGLAMSGGTGVVASGALDGSGMALDAIGPCQFSLSGLVSIPAGAKLAAVSGVSLRSGSLILATVQNNAGVFVAYALPNVSQSKITINLNKVVPIGKTAKVAWFVVN
jgi:hypothetical protein